MRYDCRFRSNSDINRYLGVELIRYRILLEASIEVYSNLGNYTFVEHIYEILQLRYTYLMELAFGTYQSSRFPREDELRQVDDGHL